jgi:hypothetical protein
MHGPVFTHSEPSNSDFAPRIVTFVAQQSDNLTENLKELLNLPSPAGHQNCDHTYIINQIIQTTQNKKIQVGLCRC